MELELLSMIEESPNFRENRKKFKKRFTWSHLIRESTLSFYNKYDSCRYDSSMTHILVCMPVA